MQREIGIIIRVKDAAKAKEEIKNIVDTKLLGNVKLANTEFKKLGDEVQRTGSNAKGATSQFDNMFKRLATGTGLLYALRRGLTAAFGSFEAGAGLERAAVQFESSIGKVNEFLPQLRNATRGTVEDMKLLSTANRAVMEGLNPKSLTKMYQMATVASRKLGLESEQAIQTISNAIVRQDESALTTLGTILKTNIGLKVQTAIMSKNAGVMSGAAAIAIRQSVIMAELNKRFGGFNQLQEDGVEIIQQFRAAMSNLRTSIGPIVGLVLAPALKALSGLANGLSSILMQLKDNPAFQAAARNIGMVLTALTAAKTIMMITSLAKAIGLFTFGIKGLAIAAGGFGFMKILGMETNDLSVGFSKVSTAASVFFQLIGSYDDNTGMSKVLTKDKEALGGFYKVIFQAAKIFMVLKAAASGVFDAISTGIRTIAPFLGSFGTALVDILESISNETPLAQSSLDKIRTVFEGITYGIVGAAGAVALFFNKTLVVVKVATLFYSVLSAVLKAKAAWVAFAATAGSVGWISAISTALLGLITKFKLLAAAKLAAMGPVGWAVLGAGAIAATGYALSQGSEANTNSGNTSTATAAPDMREQNIQAVSTTEDTSSQKWLPKIFEVLTRQDQREEQQSAESRVAPIDRTFLRR